MNLYAILCGKKTKKQTTKSTGKQIYFANQLEWVCWAASQSTCQLDEMVRAQMHIGSTVHC